jgi:hypothetical protein
LLVAVAEVEVLLVWALVALVVIESLLLKLY